MQPDLNNLLQMVAAGEMPPEEAEALLKTPPSLDIGIANIDLHRKMRQGASEVIYGEGKTASQIIQIVEAMREAGQGDILVTRLSPEKAEEVLGSIDMEYHELAKVGVIGCTPKPDGIGKILVVCGGTSDIPVAEEAALTAEMMGNQVERVFDVGVAGIHRLLAKTDSIISATAIIAVAGMEGALASVVAGIASCPVIAVPTSIGYGASFGGLSALLAMLNSCAAGVAVMNIDNGFGAGVMASRINHVGKAARENE